MNKNKNKNYKVYICKYIKMLNLKWKKMKKKKRRICTIHMSICNAKRNHLKRLELIIFAFDILILLNKLCMNLYISYYLGP
jgi:hypothetical protein